MVIISSDDKASPPARNSSAVAAGKVASGAQGSRLTVTAGGGVPWPRVVISSPWQSSGLCSVHPWSAWKERQCLKFYSSSVGVPIPGVIVDSGGEHRRRGNAHGVDLLSSRILSPAASCDGSKCRPLVPELSFGDDQPTWLVRPRTAPPFSPELGSYHLHTVLL